VAKRGKPCPGWSFEKLQRKQHPFKLETLLGWLLADPSAVDLLAEVWRAAISPRERRGRN
jgi:hypothetical protein